MIRIIIIICFVTSFLSCGSKKITTKSNISKTEIIRDTIIVERISERIRDTVVFNMKTNNRIVDSLINIKFRNFKASKISGSNRVKIIYDTLYKTIQVFTEVGETKQKETKIKEKTTQKTAKKEVTEKTVTKRTSLRAWFLFFIFGFVTIIAIKLYNILFR